MEPKPLAAITAGASGIGRAMAEAFLEAGYDVAVADRDEAALAGLRAARPAILTQALDVVDENAVAAWLRDLPRLDALLANAGIAGPTAPIEGVELEEWRRCVAVNLDGAFLAAKHATPIMKRQRHGAMVFTSSTAGLYGYPNRAPYCAAKWAVIGLAKTLAMELGPFGVRVNALCPGAVEGPRMAGVIAREAAAKAMSEEAVREGYAKGVSLRRFVRADEIARTAVFLASDAASAISGQAIPVDGHTVNPDP